MQHSRVLRHAVLPNWWVRRNVPANLLRTIQEAVSASERKHHGELCFVFEATLPLFEVLRDRPLRARALDIFSELRVWDTEHNSGVLIYIQLLDRRVEIIADRGINAEVGGDFWEGVCRRMEASFQRGDFEAGCLHALEEITAILSAHYPVGTASNPNERPDHPLLR